MIVEKAVNMANMMNIPILGIVENMSYVVCPDCGKEIRVFGESRVEEVAKRCGIDLIAKIPMQPEIAALCDAGKAYEIDEKWLDNITNKIF